MGKKYSQTKVNFWAPTVEHTKSMKLVQAQHSQTEVLVIQIIIKDLMQEKLVKRIKEVYASAIISTPWKEQLSKKKKSYKKIANNQLQLSSGIKNWITNHKIWIEQMKPSQEHTQWF